MAKTQQEKFNELIQRLINDSSGNPKITSDNFSGIIFDGLNEEEQDNFWKYLIEFLKNENDFLQHYAIRENDINEKSLVDFIQQYSDLSDETLVELIEKYYSNDKLDSNLKDSTTGVLDQNQYFWNESVSKIISYCLQHIFPNGISDLEGEEPTDEEIKDGNTRGSISMGETDGKKVSFRVKNIINGNAGNSFDKDGRWVQPWFNIDLDTYKEVRDIDPIPNVLNKSKELQFTRKPYYYINDGDKNIEEKIENWAKKAIAANLNNIETTDDEYQEILEKKKQWFKENYVIYRDQLVNNQIKREDIEDASGVLVDTILSIDEYISESKSFEKWIRLIMPKYQRRVEVEDLDRNFWVIGQILSGISSYLFGDEQPIIQAFKSLLNEIIQLWQNVFFLWFTTTAISQRKKYTDVQTIFIPIMNSELQQHIKFDNFDNTKIIELEKCWERLEYLKDQYNESNLVVIPEVRCNNYKHDYYSKVYYPGIIMYDRNLNEVKYVNFQIKDTIITKTINFWPDMNGNGKLDYTIKNTEDNVHFDSNIIFYINSLISSGCSEEYIRNILEGKEETIQESHKKFLVWKDYVDNNPYKVDLTKTISPVDQWLDLACYYFENGVLKNRFDNALYSEFGEFGLSEIMMLFEESGKSMTEHEWINFVKTYLINKNVSDEKITEILSSLKRDYEVKVGSSEPYIDLTDENSFYIYNLSGFLKEDNKYYILPSFEKVLKTNSEYNIDKEGYYYGAIRTIPNIQAVYDEELKIKNIDLSFYDVAKELFNVESFLGNWKYENTLNFSDELTSIKLDCIVKNNSINDSLEPIDINKGYYLGECVSNLIYAKEKFVWNSNIQSISLYTKEYSLTENKPEKASDLEDYLTGFDGESNFRNNNWHNACRSKWNQIQNKGKNYISIFILHSGLYNNLSDNVTSGFEINPLLSIYLLKNGVEHIYDFKISVTNGGTELGDFTCPIISAIQNKDQDFGNSRQSTFKLGALKADTFDYASDLDDNDAFEKVGAQFYYRKDKKVSILAPSTSERTYSATVGNMYTDGNTLEIKEAYENNQNILQISDFYIYVLDRAYIFSRNNKTELIKNAIPYYYKCVFPKTIKEGEPNIIYAELFLNEKEDIADELNYTPFLGDNSSLCNISSGLSDYYENVSLDERKAAELIPNSSNVKKAFESFLGDNLNDKKRIWSNIYF